MCGTKCWALKQSACGTKCRGGLTEAFLAEELGTADERRSIPERASSTIAWWQERQVRVRA